MGASAQRSELSQPNGRARTVLSADTRPAGVSYSGVVTPSSLLSPVRDAFAEERIADAPKRVWRDWAIVGVALITAVVELVLRNDLGWPILSFIACVALLPTVLWRRTHPLAMMVVLERKTLEGAKADRLTISKIICEGWLED